MVTLTLEHDRIMGEVFITSDCCILQGRRSDLVRGRVRSVRRRNNAEVLLRIERDVVMDNL
jgi:hypothetical protein